MTMKALDRSTVEALIAYSEQAELDNLTGELVRLSPEAIAELKALVWLGRDEESPKHWEALVIEARFQLDDQTTQVIAGIPDLGAFLREGLARLESAGRI